MTTQRQPEHQSQVKPHSPHQVVWFDIPALDLDRAIRFYGAVLDVQIEKEDMPGMSMGVLPHQENQVSGCITTGEDAQPSNAGLLLYFNVQGRLDEAIQQVAPSGGKILKPKHAIGPYGFRAVVLDSEGNRVALHSM